MEEFSIGEAENCRRRLMTLPALSCVETATSKLPLDHAPQRIQPTIDPPPAPMYPSLAIPGQGENPCGVGQKPQGS